MRYYKIIYNGYIGRIGVGNGGIEISQEEYENLVQIINNKPVAESGYVYKLKEDLSWELYELPIINFDEIAEQEYNKILEIEELSNADN